MTPSFRMKHIKLGNFKNSRTNYQVLYELKTFTKFTSTFLVRKTEDPSSRDIKS